MRFANASARISRVRGRIWCPHTAVAAEALRAPANASSATPGTGCWSRPRIPAKFREIVEPLIGAPVPVPPALAALLDRPRHCTEIDANLIALSRILATA